MTSLTSTRRLNGSCFVRCVALSRENEKLLREEAARKSCRLFTVDLADTQAADDVTRKIAGALNFPSYFGGNWDALFDMVTDLSWDPAPGYVVLLKNAAALLQLPSKDLAALIRLCSATVERWQSGEDEQGKAMPRTPFYFLFEEQAPFCRLMADLTATGATSQGRTRAHVRSERIGYVVIPAPAGLGWALIAATVRGVCAMLLGDDSGELKEELGARFPLAEIKEEAWVRELYEAAVFTSFQQPVGEGLPLDLRGTAFQTRVWAALRAIPRGETRSYAEVAASLGQPRAVRAVARACARNPAALLVPCHRVIASDGSLTGYRWGLDRKRALLAMERANEL